MWLKCVCVCCCAKYENMCQSILMSTIVAMLDDLLKLRESYIENAKLCLTMRIIYCHKIFLLPILFLSFIIYDCYFILLFAFVTVKQDYHEIFVHCCSHFSLPLPIKEVSPPNWTWVCRNYWKQKPLNVADFFFVLFQLNPVRFQP